MGFRKETESILVIDQSLAVLNFFARRLRCIRVTHFRAPAMPSSLLAPRSRLPSPQAARADHKNLSLLGKIVAHVPSDSWSRTQG
jgi:hypothetical protein